jgi:hypothetical protein
MLKKERKLLKINYTIRSQRNSRESMGDYRTDEIMVWFRTQIPRRRGNTSPYIPPLWQAGRAGCHDNERQMTHGSQGSAKSSFFVWPWRMDRMCQWRLKLVRVTRRLSLGNPFRRAQEHLGAQRRLLAGGKAWRRRGGILAILGYMMAGRNSGTLKQSSGQEGDSCHAF